MLNWTSFLSALIAAIALSFSPGCPEKDSPESQRVRGKDAPEEESAIDTKEWPEEPLALATKPVTGRELLPVDVALGGTTLGGLLSGNSLVVYSDADTRDKDNRAAQRAVRYLSQAAAPMGFRMVVIFEQGTSKGQVNDWYRERKIERVGRSVVDSEGAFAAASGWLPRTAALVGSDGQIGVLFPPSERWDARLGYEGGMTSDLLFRAWEPAEGAPAVSSETKQEAVGLVRSVLMGPEVKRDVPAVPVDVSPALAGPAKNPVFVSLYRLSVIRRLRGASTGETLAEAIAAATRNALLSAGDTAPEWQEAISDIRFSIDITGPQQELPTREMAALWYLVEPGVDGVVVHEGAGEEGVILPHEPVTQGLMTPRVRHRDEKLELLLGEASKRAGLAKSAWSDSSVTVKRFRSTSFGVNVPGGTNSVDMYRGNVLIDGPPDEARILESLRIGGLWLVNTVREDGKFDYEYFPNRGRHSEGYNIVRHAGSVYGLFEMAHVAGEEPALKADQEKYISAAARAMGYIYDATRSPDGDEVGDRRCLISNNRCESGSIALTLLTFLSRPDPNTIAPEYRDRIYRDEDPEIMEGYGLALLDMIDSGGKVYFDYREAMKYDEVRKEPLYYPGETMLALLLFHKKTGDPRWLEGARRIGDRQTAYYKKKRFSWPDHWVMQGLHRLWQTTKDRKYAKTAYAMATHSAAAQYPAVWTPFEDYHGAWRRKDDLPRTTRAGSRLEAVRRVVHIAWEDEHDATIWEDLLLMGSDHLIEKQYRPENMWYVPFPDKVIGAYPMGIVDNHLRIDNNQHALVGMLGALEVLRKRAGK